MCFLLLGHTVLVIFGLLFFFLGWPCSKNDGAQKRLAAAAGQGCRQRGAGEPGLDKARPRQSLPRRASRDKLGPSFFRLAQVSWRFGLRSGLWFLISLGRGCGSGANPPIDRPIEGIEQQERTRAKIHVMSGKIRNGLPHLDCIRSGRAPSRWHHMWSVGRQ